jgi:hypothetical protein
MIRSILIFFVMIYIQIIRHWKDRVAVLIVVTPVFLYALPHDLGVELDLAVSAAKIAVVD